MITIHESKRRFHTDLGWLNSWHTFSFGDHYDPGRQGFSALRVINDDTVAPGQGFGSHGHRDMEILSYVLSGALQHKDSSGGGGIIRAGEVQRMSAGSGVVHSEFNGSKDEPVHFLQIWLLPDQRAVQPGYEQKKFDFAKGKLTLLAARGGEDGAVRIHQDARVYGGKLDGAETISFELAPSRRAFVHVAQGSVELNGRRLGAGDGAEISGERSLGLSAGEKAEVLLFDLP